LRNAFIDELVEAVLCGKDIALVVGDLGYKVVEPFADRFPDRFFNAGIAEQNMIGLAAGLASEGVHVFAYSIANFPTFRCAEQIRNDVDYHDLPVTIVSVGGGLAYGNLGYSHHAVQDYALMRVMPNILIGAPGDPMEVKGVVRRLLDRPGPSYLRLGKAGEKSIHKSVPKIVPGEWLPVIECEEPAEVYLTTGATLELAYDTIVKNKLENISLYTMPIWGMKCKGGQSAMIEKFSKVSSIEDHLVDGGFGSWLLESTWHDANAIKKIKINALSSKVCGMVGKQSTLNNVGGINQNIFFNNL
jgi:transketolase